MIISGPGIAGIIIVIIIIVMFIWLVIITWNDPALPNDDIKVSHNRNVIMLVFIVTVVIVLISAGLHYYSLFSRQIRGAGPRGENRPVVTQPVGMVGTY